MKRWISRMFSDVNGVPDEARVAAFIMVLTFCGAALIGVLFGEKHVFDAQQFGIGAGALAAGLGGWFGLRKDN